ncbi:hypothetical protein [Kitasatospora sp. NPDC088346]|uniref:hypothetical protein n=1 Tax=Kitasatospora sp. NPDC088346 TaxID=3364073 RepID=UPI00380431B9
MANGIEGGTFHGPVVQAGTAHISMPAPAPRRRTRRAVLPATVGVVLAAVAVVWALSLHFPGEPVAIDAVDVVNPMPGTSFRLPAALDLSPDGLDALNRGDYGADGSFAAWFARNDAVWMGYTQIRITLSGGGADTVRITGLEVEKSDCRTNAPAGTLFYAPTGGNGGDDTELMFFQLTEGVGLARTTDGDSYFARRVITLKPGEQETVQTFVSAASQDCDFVFRLTVARPGKPPLRKVVDDHGRPFRLAASPEPQGGERAPFEGYGALYIGGAASRDGRFTAQDARTFSFSGAGSAGQGAG